MSTSRERFLTAARGGRPDRAPVWLMRQAGRYLPEYRALKERYSFLEMVRTPDLAADVTLQPMRRFPLDAAIIFSDILVVPEAMGQPYHFKDTGGIAMDYILERPDQFDSLAGVGAAARLQYVPAALRLVRQALGPDKALLGFCGSPWTLATYMVEGGSPGEGARIRSLFHHDRARFDRLMEKITSVCGDYLLMQVEAGVDAVQIFDSWGGLCDDAMLEEATLKWMRQLVVRLQGRVPAIVFGRGQSHRALQVAGTGAQVLSLDTGADLAAIQATLPVGMAVQGNLDPLLLTGDPQAAVSATRVLLASTRERGAHIFNLGHGITPQARVETVAAVIDAVAGASSS
ncbi:MAG: uroporphyrinogen decarboxylase [Candidatus Methylacidiphilales bacterium]|nr:uroporphyrinogen decarboxylase [Candidatus Methylacidiphilales bacterium]